MTWLKKYFYFFPVIFYLPAIGNFFSADDWFHLRISQIYSLTEFFNFFSFARTAQSASFYRPIPTQLFFSVFQSIFGLTAWPYYLFVLICFGYSLYLVKKFANEQFKNITKATVVTLIYGFSVSNFTRLYFLSSFQEISLVIFSLLFLLNFSESKIKSIIFFILALMSKETAIVLPLIALIFNHNTIKKSSTSFWSSALVLTVYLYFRFIVFGTPVGDSYVWDFSLIKAANTLTWYVLWSFGAPELLVDYVGSGLRLVPKFFVDYPYWWKVIIMPLLGSLILVILLVFKKIKNLDSRIVKFILFYLISLAPVIFLPSHKFTLELGLPMVGFSLAIGWLTTKENALLAFSFLAIYLFLNLSMNYLTYTRHYSVSRSKISKKVFEFLSESYPKYTNGAYFEFVNDSVHNGEIWGQSKQISQALSGSEFLKVFYSDHSVESFFEDYNNPRPKNMVKIPLSTANFL